MVIWPMRMMFVILLSVSTANAQSDQQILKLCGIEGSVNHMIGTAILKSAYDKIGVGVETVEFPAKRSLVMSNAGKFDGEVQRIDDINQHYPNLMKVPEPILFLETSAFVKNPGIRISDWDSLSSYLIGIPRGIVYLDVRTKGMNRVFVNNLEQLFHLLNLGRIDVVVISTNYGRAYLKKHNLSKIRVIAPPILKIPLFHYLHRKHKSFIPKISESIRRMRKNGEIDEIIAQFSRNP